MWQWERLPPGLRLVGVNADPMEVLCYFPQAPFLPHKAGNTSRFRCVGRAIEARNWHTATADPLRYLLYGGRWLRSRKWARVGLRATLTEADRIAAMGAAVAAAQTSERKRVASKRDTAEDPQHWERPIDRLAEPGKGTLLDLTTAMLFGF